MSNSISKYCPHCGFPIEEGRSNKEYCQESCRQAFKYNKKRESYVIGFKSIPASNGLGCSYQHYLNKETQFIILSLDNSFAIQIKSGKNIYTIYPSYNWLINAKKAVTAFVEGGMLDVLDERSLELKGVLYFSKKSNKIRLKPSN